jgi:hypothetical protein
MLLAGATAHASTLTQNLSWTIDRAGTSTRYRVVANRGTQKPGDKRARSKVIKRAATNVD